MLSTRILRSKSHPVSYDDEVPGSRKYDVVERLGDPKLSSLHNFVREMQPQELTLEYVQKHGFTQPHVLHSCEGLEMTLPPREFSVEDVKKLVGSRRQLDVIDSVTQESIDMSLGTWVKYYQSSQKERILNVISLEFSHTGMDKLVKAPSLVRHIDWVELVWPSSLKQEQTNPTNDLEQMMYPKVQKYCLMSVAGSYTDFHIDFGGTSVWYHVFRGEKHFLLVPPTTENYQAFLSWQKSGKQDAIFFPDTVLACQLVQLKTGDTFFLPSGWIHAVYTPVDSLVFGGNFLHTASIPMQLKVMEMERILKVPAKFCYPFYGQIHWYALAMYSDRLRDLGVDTELNSREPVEEGDKTSLISVQHPPSEESQKPYFPKQEQESLVHLIERIRQDGLFLNSIPPLTPNADLLLCKLEAQLNSPRLHDVCSTRPNGISLLQPVLPEVTINKRVSSVRAQRVQCSMVKSSTDILSSFDGTDSLAPVSKRRRRCRVCAGCRQPPCGKCHYCIDSPRFGGPGHLKQSCIHRKCEQLLPISLSCGATPGSGQGMTIQLTVPAEQLVGGEMDVATPISMVTNTFLPSTATEEHFMPEHTLPQPQTATISPRPQTTTLDVAHNSSQPQTTTLDVAHNSPQPQTTTLDVAHSPSQPQTTTLMGDFMIEHSSPQPQTTMVDECFVAGHSTSQPQTNASGGYVPCSTTGQRIEDHVSIMPSTNQYYSEDATTP